MIIRRSSRFKRDFKKIPKQIQKQANKKLLILLSDFEYPSLRIKKVKKYKNTLELSITMNYRCLFTIRGKFYYLERIGKHDEILK